MADGYEYRTIDLHKSNKEFYSSWTGNLTKRLNAVTEKLGKEGWELVSASQNIYGKPRVITFRRSTPSKG